ncbi:MAG TPA: NUDIX-like domain-containing protein, partial [Chitinispirillaceae bacterium]|nr:NUDIX-like domain-containing protein [Chitinispirillaceae bacterium]
MIHEIMPHRFENQYRAGQRIEENDIILQFKGNALLFKSNGDEIELPRKKDLPEIFDTAKLTFLFTLDDTPCFLVNNEQFVERDGFIFKEMNFFRTLTRNAQYRRMARKITSGKPRRLYYFF